MEGFCHVFKFKSIAWGSFELFQFFGHALKYSITFIYCNSLQRTLVQKYILKSKLYVTKCTTLANHCTEHSIHIASQR